MHALLSKTDDDAPPRFGEPLGVPAHDKNVLEFIDMYAAVIQPRACGSVIKALGAAAPLKELNHLKRVRKSVADPGNLDILLCVVHPEDALEAEVAPEQEQPASHDADRLPAAGSGAPAAAGDPSVASLPDAVAAIIGEHAQRILVVRVPRYPPHTREDCETWSHLWPLAWRAEQSQHARQAELPPGEAAAMQRHMARVWVLARQNVQQGRALNACVIVDPSADVVVGEAADGRHAHPLHHSVMAAVEAVAAWQRETWYQPQPQPQAEPDIQIHSACGKHAAPAGPGEVDEAKRQRLQAARGGAAHGIHRENCSSDDPKPGDATRHAESSGPAAVAAPEVDMQPNGACNGDAAEAAGVGTASPADRPYMCTGYDCYVLNEPCAMCAMALVHSRLRRVVFCAPDQCHGFLGGSGLRLHSKRSLNHHYAVYRLPIAECDA